MPFRDPRNGISFFEKKLRKVFPQTDKGLIAAGGTMALIIVLLIYLIGWWTLLALILVAVAVFFGRMIDRGGFDAVKDFFRNLFKGKHA